MTTAAAAERLFVKSIEAFNAGDLDGFLRTMTPGVEAHPLLAELAGAPFHGHDGIRRWWHETRESWDYQRIDIESVEVEGDHGLALISLVGRGKASGVELAIRPAMVFRLREGLCSYFQIYEHRDEARRAAGLG